MKDKIVSCVENVVFSYPAIPENDDACLRFVHIPKAGGTSIRNWFKDYDLPVLYGKNCIDLSKDNPELAVSQHSPANKFKNENSIKFTIVRHPYSRFFSGFRYLKQSKSINPERKIKENVDINDFILYYIDERKLDEVFMPQKIWFTGKKKEVIFLHKHFYVERLNEMNEFFEISKSIPILNKTTKIESLLLTDRAKEKLYNIYRWDFDYLGYDCDKLEQL